MAKRAARTGEHARKRAAKIAASLFGVDDRGTDVKKMRNIEQIDAVIGADLHALAALDTATAEAALY